MLSRVVKSGVSQYNPKIGERFLHLLQNKAFVGSQWVTAKSQKTFDVLNPANGKVVGNVPDMGVEDVQAAIDCASEAFECWKHQTPKERSKLLKNWYGLLQKNIDNLAEIMTAEAGKPIGESKGEAIYGNSFVDFYAEETVRIHGEILCSSVPTKKHLVEKHPIGVVGLITPWNFPHAMISRKAAAALAAGCTCVIKPAEDTPFTALAMASLAHEAGFPKGVINVVTSSRANAAPVGNLLCTSPQIAGISFTGSTEVGRILYKQCSGGIKRLGLELGGNAPFIVFESANISEAIKGAMASKFRNCGQTCVASNRFLIQESIYDQFVSKLSEEMKKLKIGDGTKKDVNIGPLINEAQFNKINDFVKDALSKGAKAIIGGKPLPDCGKLFFEPTLLTCVTDKMKVYTEEVFGPIVTVIPFKTEEEALCIANSTQRGLAGYFYSQDVAQIFRVARDMEVGMIGVNEGMVSSCEIPFGGIKESGLGREGSHHGIDDYTYIKYICLGGL